MDLLNVECKLNCIAGSCSSSGINSCSDRELFKIKVQINFSTQELVNLDVGLEYAFSGLDEHLGIIYILRTDTECNGLSVVAAVDDLSFFSEDL